jgi:transcriptional regulator with XRE-family HTH domain
MRDMATRKRRKKADDLLAPYLGPIVLRLRKGRMTQEELAKRVGIHPSTLGRIESGKGSIQKDVLVSLCAALGVSVGDILASAAEDLMKDSRRKPSNEVAGSPPVEREPLRILEDKIREKHGERMRSERELLEAFIEWGRYVATGQSGG